MAREVEAGRWWANMALLALFGTGACNVITGADGIVLDDRDDDGSAELDQGPGESPVASTGSGGDPSPTGPTGGAGADPGPGPETGSGAGGPGVGGHAPGPTVCEYPAGPYGVDTGDTLPPTLSWQGFAPGSATASTISIQELFDCDGSKGIHALLFDTSQFG